MADCKKCRHNYKPSACEPKCNRMCDGESDFEPITNAMRIRAMSDEELAEFLDNMCLVKADFHCEECNNPLNCDVCYLDWLQSEAE